MEEKGGLEERKGGKEKGNDRRLMVRIRERERRKKKTRRGKEEEES